MTMNKEMERLKSKMEFYKGLTNLYDDLNFIYKSNKYDKIIEDYQNKLSEVYKRFQDLNEVNKIKTNMLNYKNKILDTLDNALNDLSSEEFDILIQIIQDYIDDLN